MAPGDIRQLLSGLTAAAFLERHWQKEPLLVRDAIPGFSAIVSRDALFELATRDDVASRLVQRTRRGYTLAHGPFSRHALSKLPPRQWTLLVQRVNLHIDDADALLRRFAFLPYARLDDVMVSYAAPGGGVGPHYDSYDVFLVQASGRRRWRYGRQRDLSLLPGAPLRILRRFTPAHDAMLAPGDMLYIPPDVAHDGTAVDECLTYSIGFRAPSHQEFAEAFVDHLRDTIDIDGRYADADLKPTAFPARIDASFRRRLTATISRLHWSAADVSRFIGCFLTEPAPGVVFARSAGGSRARFLTRIRAGGLRLDRRSQLLYDSAHLYVNGEALPMPDADGPALRRLADRRGLAPPECAALMEETVGLLYDWHRHGYVSIA
jgi:50S ribosomal protein L16 3-hydroxylase